MEIINSIADVRKAVSAARQSGKRIGLVPTMGALHAGHISLINRAVADCGYVVVSIFVNPTQFGPSEDYDKYPRTIDADADICSSAGVDVIFAPSVSEMYPTDNLTWVDVEKITEPLCGASRPGHFRGVTTVCTKLFNIVCPDASYFGQKDAQQSIVIKRMVADLNMPLEIIVCPTVRQDDGLALSSRNKYLTQNQRSDAVLLSKALTQAEKQISRGIRDSAEIRKSMMDTLSGGKLEVEYLSIVNAETLEDVDEISGKTLIAIAAKVADTRLIDNIFVDMNNNL